MWTGDPNFAGCDGGRWPANGRAGSSPDSPPRARVAPPPVRPPVEVREPIADLPADLHEGRPLAPAAPAVQGVHADPEILGRPARIHVLVPLMLRHPGRHILAPC